MFRKVMFALVAPVMGVALAGAAALATPADDGCCCIVNDTGQLVCTITGEVLESCCCD